MAWCAEENQICLHTGHQRLARMTRVTNGGAAVIVNCTRLTDFVRKMLLLMDTIFIHNYTKVDTTMNPV